jgi:transglutaminase-like putative cysteine protease
MLGEFVRKDTSQPTGQLLMKLNEAIAEGLSYERRTSRGTQSPGETLRHRQVTCRDFALLMMEAARSLGSAARFVTGCVYVPSRAMVRFVSEEEPRTPGVRSICRAGVGRVRSDERNCRKSRPHPGRRSSDQQI